MVSMKKHTTQNEKKTYQDEQTIVYLEQSIIVNLLILKCKLQGLSKFSS